MHEERCVRRQERLYSLNSIPSKQHADTTTTRKVKDPKTAASTRTGSPFSPGGDGRWQRSSPLWAATGQRGGGGGGASTFFTHGQPFAADGAGVVEAVLHLAAVCPGAAPSDGQQEDGALWRLVHHLVEAPSVLQQGLVEEPAVLRLRACRRPAVDPQANHGVVLSNIISATQGHRAADWDWWRHQSAAHGPQSKAAGSRAAPHGSYQRGEGSACCAQSGLRCPPDSAANPCARPERVEA